MPTTATSPHFDSSPDRTHWLRDGITAVVLFAATTAVIFWQCARVAVFFDLSYILNVAERIASGQVPYRDFPLVHAPLTFVVQAAIIRLTGRVYFHHAVYVALVGGLATALTASIARGILRGRVPSAWLFALLLAAPLTVLGIYSIVPNPEYDGDCAFWILIAVWLLQRSIGDRRIASGATSNGVATNFVWPFAAGVALSIPLFFKQNMGLPFLLACIGAILLLLFAAWLRREQPASEFPSLAALASILLGIFAALLTGAIALHFTVGIRNYIYWTIRVAGERRLPGFSLMLGAYAYPSLAWMLPCVLAALILLRIDATKKLWVRIVAFALLAAPFVFPLAALFIYDDADERGDSLLALWPLLLVLAALLALVKLIRSRGQFTLRLFLPFLLLAAINGTMMSQQLWGSTYAIWPLLILLLAELITSLYEFTAAYRPFATAFTVLVSASLLMCGAFYTASEERLSYAQFPSGPVAHSAFPSLAGMSTPGPFLPNLDELLSYASANIPFDDGVMLMTGEDPFFFASGRAQPFPTTIWDPTCDPYSPQQIADMARQRNIRWLIVKTKLQLNADPTPNRAETLKLLMQEFMPAAQLHGYQIYRRIAAR